MRRRSGPCRSARPTAGAEFRRSAKRTGPVRPSVRQDARALGIWGFASSDRPGQQELSERLPEGIVEATWIGLPVGTRQLRRTTIPARQPALGPAGGRTMPNRNTLKPPGRFGEPPKTVDSDATFRTATPLALARRSSTAAG